MYGFHIKKMRRRTMAKRSKRDRREITIQNIRKWRALGLLEKDRASKATQRGHKHIAGLSFLPTEGKVTPAEYRRRQIKKTRREKQKRKEIRFQQKYGG